MERTDAVHVEHPDEQQVAELGITDWPIWTKEPSTFDWHYDQREVCYLLQGKAVVRPAGGEPVSFAAGDLVTFPEGMDCEWTVTEPVRKHYRLG